MRLQNLLFSLILPLVRCSKSLQHKGVAQISEYRPDGSLASLLNFAKSARKNDLFVDHKNLFVTYKASMVLSFGEYSAEPFSSTLVADEIAAFCDVMSKKFIEFAYLQEYQRIMIVISASQFELAYVSKFLKSNPKYCPSRAVGIMTFLTILYKKALANLGLFEKLQNPLEKQSIFCNTMHSITNEEIREKLDLLSNSKLALPRYLSLYCKKIAEVLKMMGIFSNKSLYDNIDELSETELRFFRRNVDGFICQVDSFEGSWLFQIINATSLKSLKLEQLVAMNLELGSIHLELEHKLQFYFPEIHNSFILEPASFEICLAASIDFLEVFFPQLSEHTQIADIKIEAIAIYNTLWSIRDWMKEKDGHKSLNIPVIKEYLLGCRENLFMLIHCVCQKFLSLEIYDLFSRSLVYWHQSFEFVMGDSLKIRCCLEVIKATLLHVIADREETILSFLFTLDSLIWSSFLSLALLKKERIIPICSKDFRVVIERQARSFVANIESQFIQAYKFQIPKAVFKNFICDDKRYALSPMTIKLGSPKIPSIDTSFYKKSKVSKPLRNICLNSSWLSLDNVKYFSHYIDGQFKILFDKDTLIKLCRLFENDETIQSTWHDLLEITMCLPNFYKLDLVSGYITELKASIMISTRSQAVVKSFSFVIDNHFLFLPLSEPRKQEFLQRLDIAFSINSMTKFHSYSMPVQTKKESDENSSFSSFHNILISEFCKMHGHKKVTISKQSANPIQLHTL